MLRLAEVYGGEVAGLGKGEFVRDEGIGVWLRGKWSLYLGLSSKVGLRMDFIIEEMLLFIY